MKALVAILVAVCMSLSTVAAEEIIKSHAIAKRGEPKYPADFEHWDYVNPDAPRKGYLTMGTLGTFDNFNRFAQRGTTPAAIETYLFDSLMTGNAEEPGVLYGLIAESIEYPTSNEWITFHLNPNATFQDGKPIMASDVAFTFNLLMTEGVQFVRTYYEGVTAEVLGERSIRFTLPKPDKSMLMDIAGFPVFPEHYFKDVNLEEPLEEIPLGSGGYTISDYQMGKYAVYERLDDYWALNHPTMVGQLNFDFERYDYYLDETVLFEAFKKGEYDLRMENTSQRWATQYNGPNFDKGYIIKEEIAHQIPQAMQSFVFNQRRPMFEDRRVRMAINLLFDFEWANKNLFYGAYTRLESYFQNTEYMATGLPEGKELELLEKHRKELPEELFTQPYENFQTDGSGNIRPQLRQALALLKEAGYELRNGKMVNATTGKPLEFELMLYQPTFERIAIPFKENLAKAGITMSVRTIDTTQYTNRMRDGDYDMRVDSLGGGAYPSENLMLEWHSQYVDSTYNTTGVTDPVVDELVQGIADNQDNDEMLLAYGRALDRVLLWRYYVVPNWYLSAHRVAYWDKFGRPETPPRYSLGLSTWWLDEAAEAALPDRNAR